MMRSLRGWVIGVVLVGTGGGAAHGAETVRSNIEISVIHALRTDAGGSIDPMLRELPQLTREQPFLRYNVYRLLDRRRLGIELGKPVADALANGRTLQITLLDVTDHGGQKRFHIRAAMDESDKKPLVLEVTASENEPFFVAGPRYRGGALFIELVVR